MHVTAPTRHKPGTLGRLPQKNSLENTVVGLVLQHKDVSGCGKLRAQGDGEENRMKVNSRGKLLSGIPNITMRSPSFCMGPCPAQTFCICKSLPFFPFSFAASSSLTAGLKETGNITNEHCD